MPLHVSVTSIKDFMTCPRLYYYKRIKKYEKIEYSIPFLVGKVIHLGLSLVFQKNKNAIKLMLECYRSERKKINDYFTLTTNEEEDLNEQEYIVQGMLKAYQRRYEKMIRGVTLIGSEVEGVAEFNDNVNVVIKLDNLIRIDKKKVLHELKTSKYITPDYVRSIRTDFQHSLYYHIYNALYPETPINEVMYDIIRKPSIRQKKEETYPAFLIRLEEWYQRPDDMAVFHVERFSEPLLTQEDVFNTVEKVSNIMLQCKNEEEYYQDFEKCYGYYGSKCPYYELCHSGGESKENLVLYQIRKPYHVKK